MLTDVTFHAHNDLLMLACMYGLPCAVAYGVFIAFHIWSGLGRRSIHSTISIYALLVGITYSTVTSTPLFFAICTLIGYSHARTLQQSSHIKNDA